ncbi:MAG: hypothetical protein R3E79_52595 [Caldilineaceae bacterium]
MPIDFPTNAVEIIVLPKQPTVNGFPAEVDEEQVTMIYPLPILKPPIWTLATLSFHHRDPFDCILIA